MAIAALILVTAVWGVTFVQVKDAVEIYPLTAFLALRYIVASAALAPPAARRLRSLGRGGLLAGAVLGASDRARHRAPDGGARAHDGDERRLHHRPLRAAHAAPGASRSSATPIPRQLWLAVALALLGLALLSGVPGGSGAGDLLVLLSTVAQALQIVMVERYANRFDVFALTFVEVAVAAVGLPRPRDRARRPLVADRRHRLGRDPRHRPLRRRVRLPRPGLGAAAGERNTDRDRLLPRDGVRRACRLPVRRRADRRGRARRLRSDLRRDRDRGTRCGCDAQAPGSTPRERARASTSRMNGVFNSVYSSREWPAAARLRLNSS